MTTTDRARVHALIDDLFGPPNAEGDRRVAVLNAHAAALAWIRDTTGRYPAPAEVAARLNAVAERMRSGADLRDPAPILLRIAADALAEHRAAA